MASTREISSFLEKKLASSGRDGASLVEASRWLVQAGILAKDRSPEEYLRELFRTGKISGAYQFPNKRWVVINRSRLPDGIKRVIPLKEAAETLRISEARIRKHVKEGELKPLDFGSSLLLFHEEEIRAFKHATDRTYRMLFPDDGKIKQIDIDKLRRQLYYLRSDIRLIAERIEELIRLLD